MAYPAAKLESLEELLRTFPRLMVAYSGGVDSSVLLAVAGRVLGNRALGVIADSPSLPRTAFAAAMAQAAAMKVEIEVLTTDEFEDSRYTANPVNRCYFCKSELFRKMDQLAKERGYPVLAYGENVDDPPAQRPGSAAAREFSVTAPLREVGLTKADVRLLARSLGLASADLPAEPCLSSRIAHGIPVTAEAVSIVERAEHSLRLMGFRILRVRLARIEPPHAIVQVGPEETASLMAREHEVSAMLLAAGFASAELDPQGYRGSGLL